MGEVLPAVQVWGGGVLTDDSLLQVLIIAVVADLLQ